MESDVYDGLVFLTAHRLSVRSAETRTIIRREHVTNGVTQKTFYISKIATTIKSLFTLDFNTNKTTLPKQ